MTWTSVSKPTTQSWTNSNPQGKEQYDQANITYDMSTTYYDSIVPNQWTDVAKPGGSGAIIVPGMVTGLLMPLTYSKSYETGDTWTRVSKPT